MPKCRKCEKREPAPGKSLCHYCFETVKNATVREKHRKNE
ncbi:putative CxxC motif protein [Halophage HF1]|uniref:CxxC motif protein n=2 Tax=Haloferacalesvirus TaxID=2843389 RepID=A0A6B9PAF6_9CAUD|nr:putative CxxC motif protein [Halorubrum phage HF2]YP_009725289.1 putative CxxC motif protein [Halophage HF1]QHD55895.1 putative CxxC motif protein [Halorubrum phage HF2]QHD55931.1 putative CxxC motif protein [Halophage HF1]QIR31097.1 putative CxxC motif protein [Halorubrum virus Hardycor2]